MIDQAKAELSKLIYAAMPEGRELWMGDILSRIGEDVASEDEIVMAMRRLSRRKKVRVGWVGTFEKNEQTWTACGLETAQRENEEEAAKKKEREEAAHDNFKQARKTLALCFTEDNYRKALEACEVWKPTVLFPRYYDYDREARQASGIKAVLRNLTDTPQSCDEIYALMKKYASCRNSVRKMVNTLAERGEAVRVNKGRYVLYRRAAE